jgi:hypothetical protein
LLAAVVLPIVILAATVAVERAIETLFEMAMR